MQEIQINESAPRHTKAIVAISLIIVVVLAFTLVYYFFFYSVVPSATSETQTESFTFVLQKPINTEQQSDEQIPQEIRGFVGKWQGAWSLSSSQTLQAALVVEEVSRSGWKLTYANKALLAAGISAIEGTTNATPTFFKQEGESIAAMQMTLPGFKDDRVVTMVFWLSETADTLFARFTDPVTQEVVKGQFRRLP